MPGSHEVTISAIDLGGNITSKSFTINAIYSVDTFINEWRNLRVNGSICEMLEDQNVAKLEEMFNKFEAFNATEKETIRTTNDIDDVTIGQTMDYLKAMLNIKSSNNDNVNQSIVNITKQDLGTTSVILISLLGFIPFIGYFLISKKKKSL